MIPQVLKTKHRDIYQVIESGEVRQVLCIVSGHLFCIPKRLCTSFPEFCYINDQQPGIVRWLIYGLKKEGLRNIKMSYDHSISLTRFCRFV